MIIAVHNEAARIREKLENTLGLDYPKDRLEIIVASDGSTDSTCDVVREYETQGVSLSHCPEQRGKEFIQCMAVREAKGAVLAFSDASAQLPKDSLRKMANCYADPKVGAVSSEDRFISADGKPVGEGVYLKYEMWLRRLECRSHSLIGLTGAYFSARRDVCENWDIEIPSDFNTALNCVRLGYVAISDPNVLCFYPDVKGKREYQRKFRTIVRGLSTVFRRRELLNPFAYGLVAFQLWSHKLARWAVPWFLLALLVLSFALRNLHWFYAAAFWAQAVFYGVAIVALLWKDLTRFTIIKIIIYWTMVNVVAAHAGMAYLFGKRITAWKPSQRDLKVT